MTSNSLVNLSNLLYLTTNYGKKNDVQFVPEKTKLVKFALPSPTTEDSEGEQSFLELNGQGIFFSSVADHLGVVRTS